MPKTAKVLLIYSCAFAVFITVSPIVVSPTPDVIIPQLVFLPIAAFLMINFIGNFRKSADNRDLPLTKGGLLVGLVILTILSLFGFMSISRSEKASATESGEEWVSQPEPNTILPTTTPSPTPILPEIIIDSKGIGFVNVRDEATTAGEILLKANDGDSFGVVEEMDGWYKVVIDEELFGFVSKNYTNESR